MFRIHAFVMQNKIRSNLVKWKKNRSRYLSDLMPIKCWAQKLAALKRSPCNFAKLKYYFSYIFIDNQQILLSKRWLTVQINNLWSKGKSNITLADVYLPTGWISSILKRWISSAFWAVTGENYWNQLTI